MAHSSEIFVSAVVLKCFYYVYKAICILIMIIYKCEFFVRTHDNRCNFSKIDIRYFLLFIYN